MVKKGMIECNDLVKCKVKKYVFKCVCLKVIVNDCLLFVEECFVVMMKLVELFCSLLLMWV